MRLDFNDPHGRHAGRHSCPDGALRVILYDGAKGLMMHVPKIENCRDGLGVLTCPCCGGGHLHQVKVDAYWRTEDASTGIHDQSSLGDPVFVDANMRGNPSARRHGLVIHFECEECPAPDLDLAIWQHKGETLIAWIEVNG
jgi:hypothetical protein